MTCERIEELLSATFDYTASVVLRSREQLKKIVTRAPEGFGTRPTQFRYDVIFLKEPLTAPTAMKSVLVKAGVDEAHAGSGALYFSRHPPPQPTRVLLSKRHATG